MSQDLSVLVLAAGYSKRMGSLTKDLPKSLLKINEQEVLVYLMHEILSIYPKQITFVTGYKSKVLRSFIDKKFPEFNIKYINTNRFKKRGHAYSLVLGFKKNIINDNNLLVIHADTFLRESTLRNSYLTLQNKLQSTIFLTETPAIQNESDFYFSFDQPNQPAINKMLSNKTVGTIAGILYLTNSDINRILRFANQKNIFSDYISGNWEYFIDYLLRIKALSLGFVLIPREDWVNINYPLDLLRAAKLSLSYLFKTEK